MLKLLRRFLRILVTRSDYSTETISAKRILTDHLLLDTCFSVNFFLTNWISRLLNISKFFSSRSLVLGRIGVLKKFCNVNKKTPALESILMKLKASNLQSETLIKNETPAQVFFREFYENFMNTFL